jgi:hypothetical protein
VLLNTFAPDLYVQYFRDLRDMIAAGQPFTPESTVEVMARYAHVPATDCSDRDSQAHHAVCGNPQSAPSESRPAGGKESET